MSFWSTTTRDETQNLDYGSMHLNESPSLYMVRIESSPNSAQSLADRWLQRCYESKTINLAEYQSRVQKLRRAVRLGIDSALTCTDSIPSALRQLTSSGFLNTRWHLISVDCDHFASEAWEAGFVCCYRNAQCILSSLFRLPDFRKRLFGALSAMPSLWKLQSLMEAAWSLGFDTVGASQLSEMLRNARLQHGRSGYSSDGGQHLLADDSRNLVGLVDSTAWLGATDLASLFGSIGVRCTVLECSAPSGPNNTHPRLLEHIYSYIQVGRVTETSREAFSVPMLLQHAGHSRIVIGVETDSSGEPTALILLDPNIPVEAMQELLRAADDCANATNPETTTGSRMSSAGNIGQPNRGQPPSESNWVDVLNSLRVDISQLTHPHYQLLQVNGLVETEIDLQDAMLPEKITLVIS